MRFLNRADLAQAFGWKVPREPERVISILKQIGLFYYAVASIYLLASFFLHWTYLSDSFVFFVLAYSVRNLKSRIAALFLLAAASLACLEAIRNFSGVSATGGSNIFISGLCFYLSLRALQLSVVYHRLIESRFIARNFMTKLALCIAYYCGFLFLAEMITISFESMRSGIRSPLWESRMTMGCLWIIFLSFAGWLPGTAGKPLCVAVENYRSRYNRKHASLRVSSDWKTVVEAYFSVLKTIPLSLTAMPESQLPYSSELIRQSLLHAYQRGYHDDKQRRKHKAGLDQLAQFISDENALFIRKLEEEPDQMEWSRSVTERYDRILEEIRDERRENSRDLQYQKPPELYISSKAS